MTDPSVTSRQIADPARQQGECRLIALGRRCSVLLTREQYTRYDTARQALFSSIGIEEKYDLLLANYTEFEAELINFGLQAMVYGSTIGQVEASHNERLAVGRRLLNLLASCRLYLDGTDRGLCTIFGNDSCERAQFERVKREHYDEHPSYQLMDQLRDHAMHRDLVIHGTGLSTELTEPSREARMAYHFTVAINPAKLLLDRKIKSSVRKQLAKMGELTDIVPFTKEYVSDLSEIHEVVRAVLAPEIQALGSTLEEALALFRAGCPDSDPMGCFFASGCGSEGQVQDYFSESSLGTIKRLASRNRSSISLDKWFVVGDSLKG